ncbi:MAG: Smr/MutS family protein [Bacteroidia bacterium]|nr:Smr/MutS family protein [Bacteroidia bacterium]
MSKITIDLHEVFNNKIEIDKALNTIIWQAIENKIDQVEIIHGKGSGQLKKRVLRFLQQPHIKQLYKKVEKDSKNFGRLFVRFR